MTTIEFQYKLINLQESLMGFAYRLTADKNDARDLVQETFLKSLKSSDKFVHEVNFKAWTFTIMKNIFINNYRHSLLQNTFRDQTKESFYNNEKEVSDSDDAHSAYSAMEITQHLEKLKDTFRIPLRMRADGYKYKEIADRLNLNIGTVKSRIFLSRRQLMDQLSR
jgi:RNA polymerase sigma-70 factor (ECF subfamily)